MKQSRVAFVHEYLTRNGGAERVLKSLRQLYPESPIYTLLYEPRKVRQDFPPSEVIPSFLNSFPQWLKKRVKTLGVFAPSAIESFDLSRFRLIISSSNSFAKGVILKPQATHVCYCHAPSLFLWDKFYLYRRLHGGNIVSRMAVNIIAHYLRQWDRQAADRVDYFIANSQTTKNRIAKFYRRQATVIYPPVDVKRFRYDRPPERFFLIVSQLTAYKNIDIAIEAFNKMKLPLLIIGEGPEEKRLRSMAGSTITFMGFLSDKQVTQYYERCQALIFPGSDDFGIVPVEAMAAGKPVLALREGGVTETIVEGVTGEFFDAPLPELIADGVRRLRDNYAQYEASVIRKQAEKFSQDRFQEEMKDFITYVENQEKSTT